MLFRSVEVPFRCDGPDSARDMRLVMTALPAHFIQCEAVLDAEASTARMPLWDGAATRTNDVLVACSWCKRLRVAREWLEPEHAIQALRLFQHAAMPLLSHSVCPPCEARLVSDC